MINILFVCHGNICRSPMAEYIFRDMVKQQGLEHRISCASAATSREEIGNPVHPGTKRILAQHQIYPYEKRARQMVKEDAFTYDFLIGMDAENVRTMKQMVQEADRHNIHRLLDYTKHPRDIKDPWYTGNFDETYEDVPEGCQALLDVILRSIR